MQLPRALRTAPALVPKRLGKPSSWPAVNARWLRLPGTRTEAMQVAALYAGTVPLLGRAATEAAVRAKWAGADVLHLATHGLANLQDPAYSALVLATPSARDAQDGLLFAYEIDNTVLQAEVVVLSACETGRGGLVSRQGAIALDRAFLVAGARSVVSSLWPVADDATAALMVAFHQQLRGGSPIDVALQRAMVQVQAVPQWQDPANWAAFRVVGAGLRQGSAAAAEKP